MPRGPIRKLPAGKLRKLEAAMTTTEGYQEYVNWTMLEETLQTRALELASLYGWGPVYHTHDSRRSHRGFPDLVLLRPRDGRVLYLELKAEGEEPKPDQIDWEYALKYCGQEHHYIWPHDLPWGRLEAILK